MNDMAISFNTIRRSALRSRKVKKKTDWLTMWFYYYFYMAAVCRSTAASRLKPKLEKLD